MKTNKKLVDIYINDVKTEFVMKLGSAGEAYFIEQTEEIGEDDIEASSPIQSESGETELDEDRGSDKQHQINFDSLSERAISEQEKIEEKEAIPNDFVDPPFDLKTLSMSPKAL